MRVIPFLSKRSLFIKIACAAVFFVGSVPATADIELVFGTYTADKATATVKKFKPVLSYLEGELTRILQEPVTIRMEITNKYERGIENLTSGKVDFSRFGPASYVLAKNGDPGIEIVVMELSEGRKTFPGVIAVHADSDIENVSDLKNQSFAFGDELSTIGRYLAQQHLLEAGITAEDLSHYAFLGRHDRVGTAVGSKEFAAGALKSSTFHSLVQKSVPIRSLAQFDNVTKPWIVRSGMPPRIVAAMREVFLDRKSAESLKSMSKHGFGEGSDQDYDIIRDAMTSSAGFGG